MWLKHLPMDEAGDGTGGAGGTGGTGGEGDKNKGAGESDSAALVKEMQTQMGVLTKAVTMMAQGQQATQEELKKIAEASAARHEEKKDGDKNDNNSGDLFDGVDLEQLDRKEYGTLLMTKFLGQIQKHMGDAVKPIQDQIKNIEATVTSDIGSRQVADAAKANADLYEWKDEIAALLKETPAMKLTRALTIARSENPEKVKALAKKYPPAKTGDEKKPAFLGLTPTSRTSDSDGKGGKMKFTEAAERAFDDVLASLGATDFNQVMGGRR